MEIKYVKEDGELGDLKDLISTWEMEESRATLKNKIRHFLDKFFPNGIAEYRAFHALTHPWIIVDHYGRVIKWAWQRVFRGWDDRAVWNIDIYTANLMVQLLKKLKEEKSGVPALFIDSGWGDVTDEEVVDSGWGDVTDEEVEQGKAKWEAVLKDMIDGFSAYPDVEQDQESAYKFEKAFDLFKKYYRNLWD